MPLLPRINTIVAQIDEIHSRVRHGGGRLLLRDVLAAYPGFLVAVMDHTLPGGVLAAMRRTGDTVRVLVDGTKPRRVQRVALAHEIGHAFLHARRSFEGGLSERHSWCEPTAERQADFFAAELLMPLWAVGQEIERAAATPARLAARFDVPEPVARRQLEAYRALSPDERFEPFIF